MEIRRTWLRAPVIKVIKELWEYLCDDSEIDFEYYVPRMDDTSRWYVATIDRKIIGVFWMRRINAVTWEAHVNVRPFYWGNKKGTEVCREAIKIMGDDTGAKKIIALIPDSCPATQRAAEAIGFKREGVQTKSWLKNGQLYDQKHYGLTRN